MPSTSPLLSRMAWRDVDCGPPSERARGIYQALTLITAGIWNSALELFTVDS
jgi:hypothetical protein